MELLRSANALVRLWWIAWLASGCAAPGQRNDAKPTLVEVGSVEPGDDCATGGSAIRTGVDEDGDGILDVDEVQGTEYVCNGDSRERVTIRELLPDPLIITTSPFSTSEQCPSGGIVVRHGRDLNRDGELKNEEPNQEIQDEEIHDQWEICHGEQGDPAEGPRGQPGADGVDGLSTLTRLIALQAGSARCPAGGFALGAGVDHDRNGVLEDNEVEHEQVVCHGNDGMPIVTRTDEVEAGAACPYGGEEISLGRDLDLDGQLDEGEVEFTTYRCDVRCEPRAGRIQAANQLDLIGLCGTYDGDLILETDGTSWSVHLGALEEITGSLRIVSTNGEYGIEEIIAPALHTIGGDLLLEGGSSLQEASLPRLSEVHGKISLSGEVSSLDLNALVTVGHDLEVRIRNVARPVLEWPALEHIGGTLAVRGTIEVIRLPALITAGGLAVRGEIGEFHAEALTEVHGDVDLNSETTNMGDDAGCLGPYDFGDALERSAGEFMRVVNLHFLKTVDGCMALGEPPLNG